MVLPVSMYAVTACMHMNTSLNITCSRACKVCYPSTQAKLIFSKWNPMPNPSLLHPPLGLLEEKVDLA